MLSIKRLQIHPCSLCDLHFSGVCLKNNKSYIKGRGQGCASFHHMFLRVWLLLRCLAAYEQCYEPRLSHCSGLVCVTYTHARTQPDVHCVSLPHSSIPLLTSGYVEPLAIYLFGFEVSFFVAITRQEQVERLQDSVGEFRGYQKVEHT